MGVDAKIFLPPQVAVHYVAEAIAIAGGAQWEKSVLRDDLEVVSVPSLELKPSSVITLAEIRFHDSIRNQPHWIAYHFEFGGKGERGVMPRSHPYWLAVGKKVVDAFGGRIDYADCDDSSNDYEAPVRWPEGWEDGPGYQALQAILRSITPVTDEDIRAMEEYAAYPND